MEQNANVQEYKLKIIKIIDETADTKTFRVESKGIDFSPGQFFMVRFEDNKVLQRAYSIASSPTDKGYLDITMNLVGEFTNKLWQAKLGDILVFKGPYGKFYFDESMKHDLVLIGGGLGITPLRSIIKYCIDKNLGNRVSLLYSAKTPKDIVYKNELEELKSKNPDYRFVFTITRPEEKDGWEGRVGRIDDELLRQSIDDVENTLFYICGSLQFAKDIRETLYSLGAQKDHVKTDIWGE